MLSFAEVACFLSHYQVWQQIANQQQHASTYRALVLEDDVRFLPFFTRNLLAIVKHAKVRQLDPDVIYIGRQKVGLDSHVADQLQKVHDRLSAEQYELVHTATTYGWGAHGYILSAAGARKLLAVRPLHKLIPVDHLLNLMGGFRYSRSPHEALLNSSFEVRNLISFTAEPVLLTQLRSCFDCSSNRARQSDLREEKQVVGATGLTSQAKPVVYNATNRGGSALETQRNSQKPSLAVDHFTATTKMTTPTNKITTENIISLPSTTLNGQFLTNIYAIFVLLCFILPALRWRVVAGALADAQNGRMVSS